jgi:aldehyde:ferredoxin oxidoreductase
MREEFAPGHEYRSAAISYDYELIYALGSMLGVGSGNDLLALIEKVEKLGLDAMSTGGVLAWLTEARSRGVVAEQELGLSLKFGEVKGYLEAMDRLVTGARGKEGLWPTASRGTAALASEYGGEFDVQLSGNEISGYHTGYGSLLGHLVGARHSHLDGAGYALDQKAPVSDPSTLVEPLMAEEQERCMLTSLHACLFARKIYGDRELVLETLASLGIEKSNEDLDQLGRSALRLKHRLKRAMGFDLSEVRLPGRFFETPSASGKLDQGLLRGAVDLYRQKIEELLVEAPPELPKLA